MNRETFVALCQQAIETTRKQLVIANSISGFIKYRRELDDNDYLERFRDYVYNISADYDLHSDLISVIGMGRCHEFAVFLATEIKDHILRHNKKNQDNAKVTIDFVEPTRLKKDQTEIDHEYLRIKTKLDGEEKSLWEIDAWDVRFFEITPNQTGVLKHMKLLNDMYGLGVNIMDTLYTQDSQKKSCKRKMPEYTKPEEGPPIDRPLTPEHELLEKHCLYDDFDITKSIEEGVFSDTGQPTKYQRVSAWQKTDDPTHGRASLSDYDCDLPSNLSESFLRQTAETNQCVELYDHFIQRRQQFLDKCSDKATAKMRITELRTIIVSILEKGFNITEAIIDVAEQSPANYLEIRMPQHPTNEAPEEYLHRLSEGILAANKILARKKIVGILSVDDSIPDESNGFDLLEAVLSNCEAFVGIDVSSETRPTKTLTGDRLKNLFQFAIQNSLPISIEIGEFYTEQDEGDTDYILTSLEERQKTYPGYDLFSSKIRFKGCTYLTIEQRQRIKTLGIPILLAHFSPSITECAAQTIYQEDARPKISVGSSCYGLFGRTIKQQLDQSARIFNTDPDILQANQEHNRFQ